MATRDIKNGLSVVNTLAPLIRTVTPTGAWVDTREFDSAMFVTHVGAGTDGLVTFTAQDADATDQSDAAAIAAANLEGTFVNADADASPATGLNTITRVGYKGAKRYLRIVATISGAPGTGVNFGVQVVLGHAHQKKVA